jgi:small subunit ribosomal protein S3Ae
MPKVAKVKDKWKAKVWVDVVAPESLGNINVARIPINEDSSAIGRVVPISLYDIFKENPEYNNVKLMLQIVRMDGQRAVTIIKNIEYAREVYRSMVRRGSSLIEWIGTYNTNDNYKVRLHVALFTPERVNWSKMREARLVMEKSLIEMVPNMTYDQLINSLLTGKLLEEVSENVKKIHPVKNAILVRMKLLTPILKKVSEAAA